MNGLAGNRLTVHPAKAGKSAKTKNGGNAANVGTTRYEQSVKLAEALADWLADQAWVRQRMSAEGLEYREPEGTAKDINLYVRLSGDHESSRWAGAPVDEVLKLWIRKYQEFRHLGNTELNQFLIDRINAARRGDV